MKCKNVLVANMKLSIFLSMPAILPVALALSQHQALKSEVNQPTASLAFTSLKLKDSAALNFTFDNLYKLQKKFLDNFIYPENQIQVGFITH